MRVTSQTCKLVRNVTQCQFHKILAETLYILLPSIYTSESLNGVMGFVLFFEEFEAFEDSYGFWKSLQRT